MFPPCIFETVQRKPKTPQSADKLVLLYSGNVLEFIKPLLNGNILQDMFETQVNLSFTTSPMSIDNVIILKHIQKLLVYK